MPSTENLNAPYAQALDFVPLKEVYFLGNREDEEGMERRRKVKEKGEKRTHKCRMKRTETQRQIEDRRRLKWRRRQR